MTYEPNYIKAVDVRDSTKLVYAFLYDEDGFFEPAGDGHLFLGPIWIVWFPETVEYTHMEEKYFNERFVTENNAPNKIKKYMLKYPTYLEWVASINNPTIQ